MADAVSQGSGDVLALLDGGDKRGSDDDSPGALSPETPGDTGRHSDMGGEKTTTNNASIATPTDSAGSPSAPHPLSGTWPRPTAHRGDSECGPDLGGGGGGTGLPGDENAAAIPGSNVRNISSNKQLAAELERMQRQYRMASELLKMQFQSEKDKRLQAERELEMQAADMARLQSSLRKERQRMKEEASAKEILASECHNLQDELAHLRKQLEAAKPADADCTKEAALTAPSEFSCPITYELFCEPVVCSDGFTYERDAIVKWLTTHNISPMTALPLPSKLLLPNTTLRNLVLEYKEKHGLSRARDKSVRAWGAKSSPSTTSMPMVVGPNGELEELHLNSIPASDQPSPESPSRRQRRGAQRNPTTSSRLCAIL